MKIFIVIIFTILHVLSVVGQMPTPTPTDVGQEASNRMEELETLKNRRERKERFKNLTEISPLFEEIQQAFSVSAEYSAKYSNFLKKKDTGLARIFSDNDCGKDIKTISLEELERCKDRPQIIGAGSLYSFRLPNLFYQAVEEGFSVQRINYYLGESEIHFTNGKFIVGKNLIQGIIVEMGDINLENVNSKTESFRFLDKWEKAKNKNQLTEQNKLLETGIKEGDYFYSNNVEIKIDTSYLLRSISYAEKSPTFWNIDQIVAFRVIGQDANGIIVILWKKMREEIAPKLDK